MTMNNGQLSNLKQAIIVSHTMNRMLKQFDFNERNSNINLVLKKINTFLRVRERSNLEDFIFATEYERILWVNTTHKYNSQTPIFALNIVCNLHSYFLEVLSKHVKLSEKLMIKLSMIHNISDSDSKIITKIECNDDDLSSTYINLFAKDSGVTIRKSLVDGWVNKNKLSN